MILFSPYLRYKFSPVLIKLPKILIHNTMNWRAEQAGYRFTKGLIYAQLKLTHKVKAWILYKIPQLYPIERYILHKLFGKTVPCRIITVKQPTSFLLLLLLLVCWKMMTTTRHTIMISPSTNRSCTFCHLFFSTLLLPSSIGSVRKKHALLFVRNTFADYINNSKFPFQIKVQHNYSNIFHSYETHHVQWIFILNHNIWQIYGYEVI